MVVFANAIKSVDNAEDFFVILRDHGKYHATREGFKPSDCWVRIEIFHTPSKGQDVTVIRYTVNPPKSPPLELAPTPISPTPRGTG